MSRTPRAEVIDGAWRRLGPGLEPLSAPDGGPLSRTVKLVLLPLVLRPSLHRELAAPVLEETGVAMVEQLLAEHRHQLRATAAWFVLLVRHLADHPSKDQISRDACYPRAFELAVGGDPHPATADATTIGALDEIAETRGEWTPAALRHALADPDLRSALSARLASRWDRTPAADLAPHDLLEDECLSFLDSFDVRGENDDVDDARRRAERAWTTILDGGVGSRTGQGLRADWWPTDLPEPARARQLGLTGLALPARPALDGGAEARYPWDRSIAARVLSVLKHSSDRTRLPDLVDLVTEEVDRACEPWEVMEETSRAMLVVGTVLAAGLSDPGGGRTRAHRIVGGMRRRESWLAWAQRQPTGAAAAGTPATRHPQERDGQGDSYRDDHPRVAFGDELADPVAAYLRRLWVRLHGAETRGTLPTEVEEIQSLLLGVFRSVLLDGRSRVRAALTRLHGDSTASGGLASAPQGALR